MFMVEPENNPDSITRIFKRVYICLGSIKKGFNACKRQLLGLDGTFMKGPYPRQILVVVGMDPNNGIYPLAYAIVEAENKDSWVWFLQCVQDDLELSSDCYFTFISDRQKGIIHAISQFFPLAEHRYCLRHIHQNMKATWRGKGFKDMLWKCATVTTVREFQSQMEELKKYNVECYKWLIQIPPQHWANSHFSDRSKSDVLLNNMCEVFNAKLVEGRDKPIISALEYVREYMMKRISSVSMVIDKCKGPLTPTATKMLEAIKKDAEDYTVMWNGEVYQVSGPWSDQCVVDITDKSCSCRRWELTGLPCKHAVAVIWYMALHGQGIGSPETWAHSCYKLETWKKVYSFKVGPINGRNMWPKDQCPTTLTPSLYKTPIGRPKKKRKKSMVEVDDNMESGGKLTTKLKSVACSKCKKLGHNSRTCKGQGGETSGKGKGAKESGKAKGGAEAGGKARGKATRAEAGGKSSRV
ncbi:hypothetical protein L1987_86854 [Smallanthus sonchifolius]|uniref:Uncharacterized protein n=1 Tax=Smallanthus sonchifolius TaxID=185202 RepID=A0ACB8Y128_9ASTR|nr:hypothetical protein L1987_86854 [Smallanthus sonchifolius]